MGQYESDNCTVAQWQRDKKQQDGATIKDLEITSSNKSEDIPRKFILLKMYRLFLCFLVPKVNC